jgi:hypothetical protein
VLSSSRPSIKSIQNTKDKPSARHLLISRGTSPIKFISRFILPAAFPKVAESFCGPIDQKDNKKDFQDKQNDPLPSKNRLNQYGIEEDTQSVDQE